MAGTHRKGGCLLSMLIPAVIGAVLTLVISALT